LKLLYKEPDGVINLNAIHAVLAAIDGARTGKKLDLPQPVSDDARKELEGILEQHGRNATGEK